MEYPSTLIGSFLFYALLFYLLGKYGNPEYYNIFKGDSKEGKKLPVDSKEGKKLPVDSKEKKSLPVDSKTPFWIIFTGVLFFIALRLLFNLFDLLTS